MATVKLFTQNLLSRKRMLRREENGKSMEIDSTKQHLYVNFSSKNSLALWKHTYLAEIIKELQSKTLWNSKKRFQELSFWFHHQKLVPESPWLLECTNVT